MDYFYLKDRYSKVIFYGFVRKERNGKEMN